MHFFTIRCGNLVEDSPVLWQGDLVGPEERVHVDRDGGAGSRLVRPADVDVGDGGSFNLRVERNPVNTFVLKFVNKV